MTPSLDSPPIYHTACLSLHPVQTAFNANYSTLQKNTPHQFQTIRDVFAHILIILALGTLFRVIDINNSLPYVLHNAYRLAARHSWPAICEKMSRQPYLHSKRSSHFLTCEVILQSFSNQFIFWLYYLQIVCSPQHIQYYFEPVNKRIQITMPQSLTQSTTLCLFQPIQASYLHHRYDSNIRQCRSTIICIYFSIICVSHTSTTPCSPHTRNLTASIDPDQHQHKQCFTKILRKL